MFVLVKENFFAPCICKIFKTTKTIYSNSEWLEQFLVTECFFNLFLEVSHKAIEIENWKELLGFRNMQEKLEKALFFKLLLAGLAQLLLLLRRLASGLRKSTSASGHGTKGKSKLLGCSGVKQVIRFHSVLEQMNKMSLPRPRTIIDPQV